MCTLPLRRSGIRLGGGWRRCRAQLRTDGTQHVPRVNTGAVAITPFDIEGVIAHGTEVNRVDVRRGDRRHHLEGIGWRLLLLCPEFATGGTRAYLAQQAIRIETLMPVIPEHPHHPLIVTLDLHRIERFTGVSHRGPSPCNQALSQGEGLVPTLKFHTLY